ncbi:MAG: T9SS type A sorting domain-containing protein [Bacteroidales bacterium]|nr:T9SS type A sorting domain-containing protein [Bacteroidales bacterium]
MKKLYKKPSNIIGIGILSLLMMASLFFFNPDAYAQTFDVEAYNVGDLYTSDPNQDYIDSTNQLKARIINVTGFTQGDNFYFYYTTQGAGSGSLTEERVLQTTSYPSTGWTDNARNFAGLIGETGTWDLYVGQWDGRFDYSYQFTEDTIQEYMGGSYSAPYLGYFNESGNRYMITDPFNLNGEIEGDVILEIDFYWNANVDSDHGVFVEYSTDGGNSWSILEDQNTDNEFFGPIGFDYDHQFTLPTASLASTTQFRVRQENSAELGPNDQDFYADFIFLFKGTPMSEVYSALVGTYNVIDEPPPPVPSITLTEIVDANGILIDNLNPALGGEEVTIVANTSNITLTDYEYFIEFDGELIDYTAKQEDPANEEIELDFILPVNIPQFFNNNNATVSVLVVDGATVDYGSGGISNRNLVTYDYTDAELDISGGTEDPAGTISFDEAGTRYVKTPPMEIAGTEGASLQFTLSRISDAIPPDGNEIVVEYSKDGSNWVQLGTDIELGGPGGVGQAGETIVLDETDLAGITSTTTQFRVRQKSTTNGADIYTWKLQDFILNIPAIGGNIEAESLDYNLYIGQPSYTISLTDPDMDPVYPGETVDFSVTNKTGEFPDYTTYEVYYGNNWLDTLTSLANFSVTVPLDNGYKTLTLRSEAKNWSYEQSAGFTIQPLSLSITDVSYDYEDAGTLYSIPDDDLQVTFELDGYIRTGMDASVLLQVQTDVANNVWETFGIQEITTTINDNQGGTVSGTLPAYDYGASVSIRILIENYPFSEDLFNYRDEFINRGAPQTPVLDAVYYWASGLTGNDLTPGAKLAFNIYQDGSEDGEAKLVYWDGVSNWTQLENGTITVTSGTDGYITNYTDINDFISVEDMLDFPDELYIGVYYPDIGSSDLEVSGLRIIEPDTVQKAAVSTSINLIYPSVTLAELDVEYEFGEEINIHYSTFGIDASEMAWTAITLEQGDLYHVLSESDQLGDVTLGIQFPSEQDLIDLGFITDTGDPEYTQFIVRARVFSKATYNDLLIQTMEDVFDSEDDFIEIVGYDFDNSQFNMEGDRFATSKAINFTDTPEPVTVSFVYSASIPFVNQQTLPQFQVSSDAGKTFTTLDIPGSIYTNRMPENATDQLYEISIPSEHLASATHFRWIQEVTESGWWNVSDVKILSGESNLIDFEIDYYPVSYSMDLVAPVDDPLAIYDNLDAYDWKLIDGTIDTTLFTPVINVGENFTFGWTVKQQFYDESGEIDTTAVENAGAILWPDTTEFEFSLVLLDEENQEYDYTFTTVAALDTFTVFMSDTVDIPTGTYDINVRAWIYDQEDKVHGFPGWVDPDAEDLVLNDAQTVETGTLIVNETTGEHLEVVLQSNTALNDDPEDATFYFGGDMEVKYEAFGPFDADVRLEVVLEGVDTDLEMVYYNLGNQAYAEAVTDTVTIPDTTTLKAAGFDLNENIYVKVYAYHALTGTEELLIESIVEADLATTDAFLSVNNGADVESLTFNGEQETDGVYTKRYAVTRSLAAHVGTGITSNSHKLVYNYSEDVTISPATAQTIPRLQVSTDAGDTFTNLEWLFETGEYELDITQAWLDDASNVYFRWIQDHPAGTWSLSNVQFVSGQSNLVEDVTNNKILITLSEVPSIYPPDFANYEFNIGNGEVDGLEPPANVGENTDFKWTVIDSSDTDNVWEEGTMFEFTMDVEDPDTEENYIIGSLTNDSILSVVLPDFIETGIYNVSVRAYVGEILQEGDEYDHVEPALDFDPTGVKQIMVVNLTEEDVTKIVTDSLPNDDPDNNPVPEFDIEEEVTVTYELFGPWPSDKEFVAAIEQYDAEDSFLERTVLDEVSSAEGSLTVKMPPYIEKDADFNQFRFSIYAYQGTAVEFGTSTDVEFIETSGDDNTDLQFDVDGDRYALSDTSDLSALSSASLEFNYMADGILENQSTMPVVLVTTDGVDFDTLMVDTTVSEFGDFGYLPATTAGWIAMSLDIPSEYLTSSAQFKFMQELNRGDNADVWALNNIEVVAGSNVLTYLEENNKQEMVLNQPEIDTYEWEVEKDADGFEPALYNNSTFRFTWDIGLDADGEPLGVTYPTATEFEFYIVNYPEEDSIYMLNATKVTGEDSIWEVTLPAEMHRDDYPVIASIVYNEFAYADTDDFSPPYVDGTLGQIGTLKVFNPLLITSALQDEVLYAGDTTSFTAEVENDVAAINPDWYYNLIITDQNEDDWLLAANQGSVDFTDIVVPPFVAGNIGFEIKASIGASMGTVGEMIEGMADILLDENAEFLEEYTGDPHELTGNEGDKVTLTTVALDLTNIQSVKFDLMANELEMTDLQKLKLEYSIDNGATFQEITSYPDARIVEEDLGTWFSEEVDIPAGAQSETTHLRWKIEEFKYAFSLQNISLAYVAADYTAAPMATRGTDINIARQRIDIVSTDKLTYCNQDMVEFTYLIRGAFGSETVMTLESNQGTPTVGGIELTIEGITSGTGILSFSLAQLDDLFTGSGIKIRLDASDETVEDYEYTVTGDYNDAGFEVISEIPENTTVYAQSASHTSHVSCESQNRVVVIGNVVENFSYQLRNFRSGDLIGSAVIVDTEDDNLMDPDTYPFYDPLTSTLEISIGTITQELHVEVVVTSQNEAGDVVCSQVIPDMQAEFDVRPLFSLHYDLNNTGVWKPMTSGQTFTICDGFTELELTMGYWKDGTFISSGASWYRDDMTKPLGSATTLSTYSTTGDYFALFNDGTCGAYLSDTVTVTVNEKPVQPVITVDGETELCEGETVTLTAPAGYNYYRWTNNFDSSNAQNTQSIVVSADGTYRVEVSDVPFEDNCFSVYSDPVYVDVFEFNTVWFNSTELLLCNSGDSIAQVTVNNIQEGVTYYLVDDDTGLPFGDPFSGSAYSVTFNTNKIEKNTSFTILAINDEDGTCSISASSNTLKVKILPQHHTLVYNGSYYELAGSDNYCEGVILSVGQNDDAGVDTESVTWYRDGYEVGTNTNYTTDEPGVYHAKIMYGSNCSYTTEQVTILGNPDRPSITITGDDTFCSGEGSAELSAPSGFAGYVWSVNGASITESSVIDDNSITPDISGNYTVAVVDEFGCQSAASNGIQITVIPLPDSYSSLYALNSSLCGPDKAQIVVGNYYYDRLLVYQLVDMETGELVGEPETVKVSETNTSVTLESDTIYEMTEFGVMVYDQNINGCETMLGGTVVVNVLSADVFVNDNVLTTNAGALSYQWYRNGVAIPGNRGATPTLEVFDDAEYTVDVEFSFNCILTSDPVSVDVDDIPLPMRTSSVQTMETLLCGASTVEIRVSNIDYNRLLTYQLVDMSTGALLGDPVIRTVDDLSDFILLETDVLTEMTEIGVWVYDQNITGNEVMLAQTVIVDVNIAEIVVVGNQLIATPGAQSYQWYRNDEPIMGERGTSGMLEIYDGAEYSVTIVFSFDCILTATSTVDVKNLTGLSDELSGDNVNIYPNPTRNMVQIDITNNYIGDITVEITNIAGQTILNRKISKQSQLLNITMDMEQFEEGIYFINFITDDGQTLVKNIVKK